MHHLPSSVARSVCSFTKRGLTPRPSTTLEGPRSMAKVEILAWTGISHVKPVAREATAGDIDRMQGIHRETAIAFKRSNLSNCLISLLQPLGSPNRLLSCERFSMRQALGTSPCDILIDISSGACIRDRTSRFVCPSPYVVPNESHARRLGCRPRYRWPIICT